MSLRKCCVTISAIILIHSTAAAAPQGARAVKVSGGESHTLLLTEDRFVWGCGFNKEYQLGIGNNFDKWTLIRTEDGNFSKNRFFYGFKPCLTV